MLYIYIHTNKQGKTDMTNVMNTMRHYMTKRKYNGMKPNQHKVGMGGFTSFDSYYEIVGEL